MGTDEDLNLKELKKLFRNNRLFLFFILLFLFGLSFHQIFLTSVQTHEIAHREIGKMYGCVDYEIKINNIIPSGSYVCLNRSEGYAELPDEVKYQENFLHSFNEILSYNLDMVIFSTLVCGFIIGTILITLFGGWQIWLTKFVEKTEKNQ